ncbi:unnamed protein product [Mycena citricolor]|uniref:Fe2OG dioxygenase domain-containing protein n=1 Tax=Mycena citricolor TaxID=2018698 RepID=A0AAD2GWX7_9AGAR|nr:unnamed protein product [Mycena citricolor]
MSYNDIVAIPRYILPNPTLEQLDYAELPVIDFARLSDNANQLAAEATEGMRKHGFLVVINHGLTVAQIARAFDIADLPFSSVGHEEKMLYAAKLRETGSHQGYKPRNYWHIDNGVYDQLEAYTIHRDVNQREHPQALGPVLAEIQALARFAHLHIVHSILRLLAIGLELPENTFVDLHRYDATGESTLRFIKYHPRTAEDEAKTKNVWLKGHTDIGSITVLFSQPVSGLQILGKDGKWRWVKHIENGLIINAGDALERLSGGYYKPTIHRVVQPPADQRHCPRLGLFYFATADDDVKLVSCVAQSPILRLEPTTSTPSDDELAPTMETWRKTRVSSYGSKGAALTPASGGMIEEETIAGIVIKHYN